MEEKLIVAVCGHPVLYDTTAVFYRDRYKKEEAWAKVGAEVGLTVEVCRKKWKGLRDTYLKKKREGERRSGSAGGELKKWRFSAVLSFLEPFTTPRETSGNMGGGFEEDGAAENTLSLDGEGEAGPSGEGVYDDQSLSESEGTAPAAASPAAASPAAAAPASGARTRKRKRGTEMDFGEKDTCPPAAATTTTTTITTTCLERRGTFLKQSGSFPP
ncbi:transcription factor Adf-1-like [Scomber scombrus]|uniref:Transcription factor Adf-1-like n=1 Tax=Scomber scombrus TaxID=13677 RepID=A0AAV1PHS2_SCOSC